MIGVAIFQNFTELTNPRTRRYLSQTVTSWRPSFEVCGSGNIQIPATKELETSTTPGSPFLFDRVDVHENRNAGFLQDITPLDAEIITRPSTFLGDRCHPHLVLASTILEDDNLSVITSTLMAVITDNGIYTTPVQY